MTEPDPYRPDHPPRLGTPTGPGQPPGTVIVEISELAVTSTVVHTPAGDIPLRGSTWQVTEQWSTEQRTPTWAVVAAVLGFCVLTVFSLLFLLVKQAVYRGTVLVTVSNGPSQYVARIPVAGEADVQQIHHQVNYVRSLAAL